MSILTDETWRRRGFAIISHPDAGKTTLTEKLLLFGGAIQVASEVKARVGRRRVRSDWMAVERERGSSVSSAVMSFAQMGPRSIVRYGRGGDGRGVILADGYGVWTRRILDEGYNQSGILLLIRCRLQQG